MGEAKRRRFPGRTTRLAEDHCLDCGKLIDAASGLTHRHRPRPNDVTICLDCGHIMIFDAQLRVRAPTDAEIVEMAGDPEIVAIQNVRAAAMKAGGA